jgi:hypothetical protein
MKKLFFGLLLAASFGLTSCGGDDGDCQTCTLSLLGIETSQEVCPDGDGVRVTTSAAGQSASETIAGTTVSEYAGTLSASGFSCN